MEARLLYLLCLTWCRVSSFGTLQLGLVISRYGTLLFQSCNLTFYILSILSNFVYSGCSSYSSLNTLYQKWFKKAAFPEHTSLTFAFSFLTWKQHSLLPMFYSVSQGKSLFRRQTIRYRSEMRSSLLEVDLNSNWLELANSMLPRKLSRSL